jgi:hypothetical protein
MKVTKGMQARNGGGAMIATEGHLRIVARVGSDVYTSYRWPIRMQGGWLEGVTATGSYFAMPELNVARIEEKDGAPRV